MSRGRVPNVNASLIREARMLYQQFFAGRPNLTLRTPATPKAPVLKCGFRCSQDALYVINGWSVCRLHEGKARGASNRPNFPGE